MNKKNSKNKVIYIIRYLTGLFLLQIFDVYDDKYLIIKIINNQERFYFRLISTHL